MTDQTRVLAARWILPISGPPIQGGWIRLAGQEVVQIGQGSPPRDTNDLGDVAILPGLVNAHTHLEFSDLRQPIGSPGIELHDWIGQVIAARHSTSEDIRQRAIVDGWEESRRGGVQLIGEITTPPCHYPTAEDSPELVTFAEVLGLSEVRGSERWAAAASHNEANKNGAWSPHAPYSASLPLIDRCVESSKAGNRLIAMHVAECAYERELLVTGGGPFAEALRELGVWRSGLFPWGDDPFVRLIDRLSQSPRALLIHGNDLKRHEIHRLAAYRNLSVVYCPRTHAFFGHPPHPVGELLKAGVRVALGTDSRASNPDLNLWQELQYLLNHRTDLPPSEVLRMATINGAEALGRRDLGKIAVGSQPWLGYVATQAGQIADVYADLANAQGSLTRI